MADLLVRVVASFEQFRPTPYVDPVGIRTVGFGHVIKPGERIDRLTRDQAEELLSRDLAAARGHVDRLFRDVFISDHERDALTSFTFNVGGTAVENSSLRQKLRGNSRLAAASEFLRWVYGTKTHDDGTKEKVKLNGLVRRRDCECVWFLGAPEAVVARIAGADVIEPA